MAKVNYIIECKNCGKKITVNINSMGIFGFISEKDLVSALNAICICPKVKK